MKQIFVALILSMLFAFAGMLCYGSVLAALLPRVVGVEYSSFVMTGQFSNSLWFAMIFGFVPIAILLVWRTTKTKDAQGKLVSVVIILAFMLAALTLRYFMINAMVTERAQVNNAVDERLVSTVDVKALKYNLYLFLGLVVGFVVAFNVLRHRHNREVVDE